ncbi:MAG: hypothetical protein LBR12_02370 [Opitutaceae bacterium]|jgi:hypothetical protein|nr:hypothetical protein [Opitutaceae bacterium]
MNRHTVRLLLAFAALASCFSLTGCRTPTDADNTVPWNRPADWEGAPPGMSGMMNQQKR